ncbi:MAG: helix-turn-helix domain-containing protein, partial [Lachnospiraceae bacterium]
MKIYEKIFARLEELHMSQSELSRKTGISTSTINDWKNKEINPQADKLAIICNALDMSLVDLLCADEEKEENIIVDYNSEEKYLIECYRNASGLLKRHIVNYIECLFLSS